ELGGMGLIRNAIKQGAMAGKDALLKAEKLSKEKTDYDLIVIGAGPAGLAASLTAIAEKKSYLCIEQGSFGGTIYNFPRQKIVMSYPIDLPVIGPKKFESNKISKEQLLEYWNAVRKKTGLKITEQVKFESLEKKENCFFVKTSSGQFTAKKVILCMGVRGSARKLGVQGEESDKVTYNLIEPEQYQQKNIVVVGGGNAGVEAAQMLSEARWKNKVHLLVRSKTFDRCNEDNINKITSLQKKGLVHIWFNSSVEEILKTEVKIKKDEEIITLKNDFVFIFAGAEMPRQFLMSLGIVIDKKFAEGLSS
ncbi:MAG: NAD(P)/FAD-dependent oxidoreductase, partial [Bdellovibrionales bacterium]